MMKMTLTTVATVSMLLSGAAMAQSAKFTSVWDDSAEVVRSDACSSTEVDYCEDLGITDYDTDEVATTVASIKIPQDKELLVGLSAQVSLWTSTEVKGKRGSYSRALAFAEGGVYLYACNQASSVCYEGQPGYVVLSNRTQELEAILGGVIESCIVDVQVDTETGTGSGSFDLADCVVQDEMIALGLTTMAAHHFNFLFPNLPQGDYDVVAKLSTEAAAESEAFCAYDPTTTGCTADDGDATAQAYALIGKHIMTVQEVRAVKDEGGDPVVID